MNGAIEVSEEVAAALLARTGIVALETSVLAQGLPAPRNLEAAESMTAAVRAAGAVPAWIGIWEGSVRVGLDAGELARLAGDPEVRKAARRDLPLLMAAGLPGATTVSATVWAAHAVGVDVVATGGIGGVHPRSGDVSADLLELARVPAMVVCSGPKSIVDPAATLERLEELGIAVVGYGTDRLPFFVVRDAGIALEYRLDSPGEAAAALAARRRLRVDSSILVCNPVPEAAALPSAMVAEAAARCEEQAEREGVSGKAVTPFLLSCMAVRTSGATLEANLALLEANAALAGRIASAAAPPAVEPPGPDP